MQLLNDVLINNMHHEKVKVVDEKIKEVPN